MPERPVSGGAGRFSAGVLVLAVLGALLLLAAPLGVQVELWDFRVGFTLLRWAVYAGLAAIGLGLAALVIAWRRGARRGAGFALAAVVLAAATVAPPLIQYRRARTLPPINDVATSPADPPPFTAAGRGAENGAAGAPYPEEFAAQQRQAYPDLRTLRFEAPPGETFEAALELARAMPGWEVALADSAAGRIEATVTTRWFRFLDDVSVRVRAAGGGSELDVRSRSRVGRSDVGANALRIREFSERLRERMGAGWAGAGSASSVRPGRGAVAGVGDRLMGEFAFGPSSG